MLSTKKFEVAFPKSPYSAQLQYSEKLKEAFVNMQNALLESPTGTGKTLALLCTSLQFQKKLSPSSKIFFATRTHTQINNICKELKLTLLNPKICLLASREAYCLDKSQGKQILEDMPGFCKYCQNKNYNPESPRFADLEAWVKEKINYDMEEFKTKAKSLGVCPYSYQKRVALPEADLIIGCYAYLLDERARKNL